MDAIAILDFGSQYAQLIARRVRETQVYCELFSYDTSADAVLSLNPKGFILSGGPSSVYEPGAAAIPDYVLRSGLPILGICYGMQALTHQLGGQVAQATKREYGLATIETLADNPLLSLGSQTVWMSHGDRIIQPPAGFQVLACSENSPFAAIASSDFERFGLQFHPEVQHTPGGLEILRRFVTAVCGAKPEWMAPSIIDDSVQKIRSQVGEELVIAAVSGGIDSTVAAALVHRAIGDQLTCIFVDTGLLRAGEAQEVAATFKGLIGARFHAISAQETFLEALQGETDPEAKRRIIGEKFIRSFEQAARQIDHPRFLMQGTIYPDVVESSGPDRRVAARIKTHHNVGGLPPDLSFELVEPLRYLFKDEVRKVGLALGLPPSVVWRHPFPGPGLAVRCLGEVTFERLERLRAADKILLEELNARGLLQDETAQAFVVLLPIRSVGVMGDQRTYAETVVIRAVTSEDFMTADWARLPYELLARVSSRIVNEVVGVNRVAYDISSKPPATIEWE
jgi:GMP synthase (glutamine-hydrolysing)